MLNIFEFFMLNLNYYASDSYKYILMIKSNKAIRNILILKDRSFYYQYIYDVFNIIPSLS